MQKQNGSFVAMVTTDRTYCYIEGVFEKFEKISGIIVGSFALLLSQINARQSFMKKYQRKIELLLKNRKIHKIGLKFNLFHI